MKGRPRKAYATSAASRSHGCHTRPSAETHPGILRGSRRLPAGVEAAFRVSESRCPGAVSSGKRVAGEALIVRSVDSLLDQSEWGITLA